MENLATLDDGQTAPIFIGLISLGKNYRYNYKPFSPTNYKGGPLLQGAFLKAVMEE